MEENRDGRLVKVKGRGSHYGTVVEKTQNGKEKGGFAAQMAGIVNWRECERGNFDKEEIRNVVSHVNFVNNWEKAVMKAGKDVEKIEENIRMAYGKGGVIENKEEYLKDVQNEIRRLEGLYLRPIAEEGNEKLYMGNQFEYVLAKEKAWLGEGYEPELIEKSSLYRVKKNEENKITINDITEIKPGEAMAGAAYEVTMSGDVKHAEAFAREAEKRGLKPNEIEKLTEALRGGSLEYEHLADEGKANPYRRPFYENEKYRLWTGFQLQGSLDKKYYQASARKEIVESAIYRQPLPVGEGRVPKEFRLDGKMLDLLENFDKKRDGGALYEKLTSAGMEKKEAENTVFAAACGALPKEEAAAMRFWAGLKEGLRVRGEKKPLECVEYNDMPFFKMVANIIQIEPMDSSKFVLRGDQTGASACKKVTNNNGKRDYYLELVYYEKEKGWLVGSPKLEQWRIKNDFNEESAAEFVRQFRENERKKEISRKTAETQKETKGAAYGR